MYSLIFLPSLANNQILFYTVWCFRKSTKLSSLKWYYTIYMGPHE